MQHRPLPGLIYQRVSALLPGFRCISFFGKMWLLLGRHETELSVSNLFMSKDLIRSQQKKVLDGVCKGTFAPPKNFQPWRCWKMSWNILWLPIHCPCLRWDTLCISVILCDTEVTMRCVVRMMKTSLSASLHHHHHNHQDGIGCCSFLVKFSCWLVCLRNSNGVKLRFEIAAVNSAAGWHPASWCFRRSGAATEADHTSAEAAETKVHPWPGGWA